MKNKTVVAGCSWTTRKYVSRQCPEIDTTFEKWDQIVARQYGWDTINTATVGAPNALIIKRALDAIHTTQSVERCVIALSEWGSFLLPDGHIANPILLTTTQSPDEAPKLTTQRRLYDLYPYNHKMHVRRVQDLLFTIHSFIDTCVLKGIEVVMLQTIPAIESFKPFCTADEYEKLCEVLLEDPYLALIRELVANNDTVQILGDPFALEDGTVMHALHKLADEPFDWTIKPPLDYHPNGRGHRLIADVFIEGYVNNYGVQQ